MPNSLVSIGEIANVDMNAMWPISVSLGTVQDLPKIHKNFTSFWSIAAATVTACYWVRNWIILSSAH